MATKTPTTAAKPAKSKDSKTKPGTAEPSKTGRPAGPLARLAALHGSKAKLVAKLAPSLAHDGAGDDLEARLGKASNKQLLHLASVVEAVTKAYGSRDKLVASLVKALGKAKDKDYVARLSGFSLPRLYDLARATERRAKAASKKA